VGRDRRRERQRAAVPGGPAGAPAVGGDGGRQHVRRPGRRRPGLAPQRRRAVRAAAGRRRVPTERPAQRAGRRRQQRPESGARGQARPRGQRQIPGDSSEHGPTFPVTAPTWSGRARGRQMLFIYYQSILPGFQNGTAANRPFLVFDFRALWRLALSARVPECQKPKMVG